MLDLFSGIGGFSLAATWVWGDELEIVAFVEKDEYCQKVLKKHWPDVPVIGDIRDAKTDTDALQLSKRAAQGTKGNGKRTNNITQDGNEVGDDAGDLRCAQQIDILTGGFPCQPFSVAGKQRGEEDDRFLWPEMFRVISEVRPTWVIAENVAGIVKMALDDCISDLEGEGYEVQTFVIPACTVNAPHRRDRVWMVAYSDRARELQQEGHEQEQRGRTGDGGEDVGNTKRAGQPPRKLGQGKEQPRRTSCRHHKERTTEYSVGGMVDGLSPELDGHFDREPEIPRVATGVKNRVDRLKGLGNAIVPQVVYEIMMAIKIVGVK